MSRLTLRHTALASSLCCALAAPAAAQERPDPSAIGNGPRALGMAQAVTAVVDDITAIGWNPAGLTFLERPEYGFVSRVMVMATGVTATTNRVTPSGFPRFTGDGELAGTLDALEFAGIAVPFQLAGRTVAVGVAYRRFAETPRVGAFKVNRLESNGRYFSTTRYFVEEGLRAISPTVAVALSDRLRLGVTANLLGGEEKYVVDGPIAFSGSEATRRVRRTLIDRDISGLALDVGAMFQATERLRIGVHATLPHDRQFTRVDSTGEIAATRQAPLQLNVGVARKMGTKSVLSADVHLAPWAAMDLTSDADGSDIPTRTGVGDATGVHVGWERDFTNYDRKSAIRLGAFVRRTSFVSFDDKQVSAYGATIGQSWYYDSWSFDGGVLLGRSTRWLRSQATDTDVSLQNTDLVVSLGLRWHIGKPRGSDGTN
ncbi:MAG: hypothetical protein KF709_01270 [Gemmatimonadaceae bacterium]|nr:hypothetical protein [Gemmatimonadaceae bacterium]